MLAQHKQVALLRVPPSVDLGRQASRWKVTLVFALIMPSGPCIPAEESFRSSLRTWCLDLETFTRDGDCKPFIGF